MLDELRGGFLLALQHLLHQVNAPARAVELVPEQDVSGAGSSAKTAMDAGAQDLVRFADIGVGELRFGKTRLHSEARLHASSATVA